MCVYVCVCICVSASVYFLPLPQPPLFLQLYISRFVLVICFACYWTQSKQERIKPFKKKKKNNNNNKSRHSNILHSQLPYTINHHEHLTCFMQLYNRMTSKVLAFLWLWANIKVTQTRIKLQSVSRIIPCFIKYRFKIVLTEDNVATYWI